MEILLQIIKTTTPLVIKMYKEVYNNLILNSEKIENKAKEMIEADRDIKTTYMKPKEQYTEEQKEKLNYLWSKLK